MHRDFVAFKFRDWFSAKFKCHKFLCGPQDQKMFSLGPRRIRSWPSLICVNILVLPMTEVTAPAKRRARLVIRGQKAPISATHNLPKMSVAESMEMQRAVSALE
jgi:hypothetical protein